jgi:hypothetical protein
MIRMKGAARTPSCFAVAGPPAVPECRKAVNLAVAAAAYVKSVQGSRVRPVFAQRSGSLCGFTKASAAGSILHMACTRTGIPWYDKTWKLNELERPE